MAKTSLHGAEFRLLDFRPVSWSENSVRKFAPDAMDQETKAWEYLADRNENLSLFDNDGVFNSQLIPQGSDWALGHMKASVATSRMMKQDYWRGVMGRDAAAQQIQADRMMRGRDNLRPEVGGALTEETRAFLEPFQSTGSNWVKGMTQGIESYVDPLAGTRYGWGASPEDLWDIKMPGFTIKKFMEELAESDPAYHAFLMQRYGGPENMEETLGKANNPDHFFYLLNTDIEQRGLQASIQHHQRHMDGIEEFWNLTAWPFLRDGLLNDPDMPASVALSIATMGAGALFAGSALALRAGMGSKRIATLGKFINKPILRPAAKLGSGFFKVTDYLPENIATTLVKKNLWKNIPTKGIKGIVANAPFNAVEGFIEGGLAEFFNQSLKIDKEVLDEYSLGAIFDEAVVEAGFSVVANPLLGGLMKYTAGFTAGLTMNAAVGKGGEKLWKNTNFSERTRAAFKEMFESMGKEGESPIIKALDVYDMSEEIASSLNTILGTKDRGLTGNNIDLELAAILEPLTGILERGQAFEGLVAVKSALDDIATEQAEAEGASTMSSEMLIDRLLEYAQTNEAFGPEVADEVWAQLKNRSVIAKFKLAAYRYYKKQGMTPTKIAQTYDEGDMTDEDLMNILEEGEGVRDSMIKGMLEDGTIKTAEEFEKLTPDGKMAWLNELDGKSEKRLAELEVVFKKDFVKVTKKAEKLNKKLEEEGVTEPTTNPDAEKDSAEVEAETQASLEAIRKEFEDGYGVEEAENLAASLSESLKTEKITPENAEGFVEDLYRVFRGDLELDTFVEQSEDIVEVDENTQTVIGKIVRLYKNGINFTNPFEVELLKISSLEHVVQNFGSELSEIIEAIAQSDEVDHTAGTPGPAVEEKPTTPKSDKQTSKEYLTEQNHNFEKARKKLIKKRDASKERKDIERFNKLIEEIDELLGDFDAVENTIDLLDEENEKTKKLTEELHAIGKKIKEAKKPIRDVQNKYKWEQRQVTFLTAANLFNEQASKSLDEYSKTGDKAVSKDQTIFSKSTNEDLWNIVGTMLESLDGEVLKADGSRIPKNSKVQAKIDKVADSYKQGNPLTLADAKLVLDEYSLRTSEITTYAQAQGGSSSLENLVKEYSKVERALRREKFKITRERAGALGLASLQIRSVSEALNYRRHQNERLDRRVNRFNKIVDLYKKRNITKATAQDFLIHFPDGKIQDDLRGRKEDEMTLDEAQRLFDEAVKSRRKYIRQNSKPGSFRGMDIHTVKNNPSITSQWSVHALGEIPASNRTNQQAIDETKERKAEEPKPEAPEDRNYRDRKFTKSKIIDRLIERGWADESQRKSLMRESKDTLIESVEEADYTMDLESKSKKKEAQVRSLLTFHAALVGIKDTHWFRNGEGLVPIAIIDSALPNDIFDTQLVTWFREAMRDIDGTEIPSRITGEDLLGMYDTLLVDVDQVLKLVSTALAKANTDLKDISKMGIEQLTQKLNDPDTPESKFGLITALNLVRRLQAASTTVNRKLFKPNPDEDGKFVLSYDSVGGYEYNFNHTTTDSDVFVSTVRDGFKHRLENRIVTLDNGWGRSKAFKHLVERYGVSPDTESADHVTDIVFKALQEEADGVTREDIIKMGNGELSFMPASMLGEQLFEFILSRDGIQPATSKRNRDYRETTLGSLESQISPKKDAKIPQGESEVVLPFLYGELNIITPEPLEKLALVLEDSYLRERIRHITQGLKRDPDNPEYLDLSVHEEYERLIAEVGDLSDEPRAISPSLKPGVRVRPYIQNAVLHGEMLSREELEDALVELLLGHAHTGYYFIHDNKFSNYRSFYTDDTGDTHEVLTLGDPTIGPMSGIGSQLALQQMMPHHPALTDAIIEEQIRLEKEFAEQGEYGEDYWNNPKFWEDILSPKMQKDRKFNGYYVSKILGITDEEVRKSIQEISDSILSKSVPDMYINKGIAMFNYVKKNKRQDLFGPLESVFQFMEDSKITDHATWEAAVKQGVLPDGTEVSPDMQKKLDVLRDFLKNPMMTRLYEAGWPSFIQYWTTGEGLTKIWPMLEDAGLVTPESRKEINPTTGIPEVIYRIGQAMYGWEVKELENSLSIALNLEDYKDRAKDALKIDERFSEGLLAHWAATVEGMSERELPADHHVRKIDYYRRQLSYNIDRMAQRRGYEPGTEKYEAFVTDENNKIVEAQRMADDMFENLNDGEDLTSDQEAELMAKLQPKNAWKENLYFLGLNTMNASGFKMFIGAMEVQAAALNVEFNRDWLMGLEEFTLYHTFMPGEESHRTYPTSSGLNRHHHTVAWGKINDNPEALKAWLESEDGPTKEDFEALAEGDSTVIMQKVWDWLETQKGESPAGVWKMEDHPHYIGPKESVSKEEWDAADEKLRRKVKDIILIDNLIGLAMFDKVPLDSYIREDNMESLDRDILSNIADPKAKRSKAYKARLKFQQRSSTTRDMRQTMAKVGQMAAVHPDDLSPVATRGTHEWSHQELSKRDGVVTESTSNPMGVFAWQPRAETTPYLGFGNLELRRRLLDQEVEEAFGPLREMQAELDAETDPLADVIPEEHRGHVKPWDRDSLPPAVAISDADLLDSMMGLHFSPAYRQAARMERDLRVWAEEHGMSDFLNPESDAYDRELIPYFYLVSQVDAIIDANLTSSIAPIRYGANNRAGVVHTEKEEIIHAANRFKDELMSIFFLPRNIIHKRLEGLSLETKGHEIGIVNPELANLTIRQILTSIYDSENNETGVLSNPTLMHKALGYGLVPKEHFVISRGLNPEEGQDIKESETDVWPLIVQSHDFQSYFAEILWDTHTWPAIAEFSRENDNKYDHIFEMAKQKDEDGRFRRKEAWNSIEPQDRKVIINKARQIRLDKEANSVLFEMSFIVEKVEGTDDLYEAVMYNKGLENKTKEAVDFRNAFGGPFSFLIRSRRVMKGANIKFGLTPEGAMLMLASNTNQALKERLELAYHNKKRLGVKKDSRGKYINVESEAETLRQENALDMRAAYNNAILESDALRIMVGNIDGQDIREGRLKVKDDGVRTLVDGTRKVQGIKPTVVDWTHYGIRRVNGVSFLVESLVAPLRKTLYRLKATGVGNLKGKYDKETPIEIIEKLLNNINNDMTDPDTMVVIQTALLMRDPKMRVEESLAIMDQITSKDTDDPVDGTLQEKISAAAKTMAEAERYHKQIERVFDASSSEVFSDHYRDALVFIERINTGDLVIESDADLDSEFIKFIVERRDLDEDPLTWGGFTQEASLALVAALQHHETLEKPIVGLDENGKPIIPRRNADHRNHRSFIAAYDNDPQMVDLSKKINKLYKEGSLEGRMLRAVIGRVWEYNPSIIRNVEFNLDGLSNFMEKISDDDYKLGIARFSKGLEKPAAVLAYALAHEFSHVGYTKFINERSADHRKWRQLFLKERQNPDLIRQVVLAAHGGVDSPAVQKEINYYLNYTDPKTGQPSEVEFVAALTGYYILNDSLPPIAATESSRKASKGLKGMIQRIMSYVNNMMSKISGAFHNFKTEKPEEWAAVEMLIERTMGYDRRTNTFGFEQGNRPTGPLKLDVTDEAPSHTESAKIDEDIAVLAEEALEVDRQIDTIESKLMLPESDLSEEAREELAEEVDKLSRRADELQTEITERGGNEVDPFNLTRADYARTMSQIRKRYGVGNEIDLDALMANGNKLEYRTIASYITRQLSVMYEGDDGNFALEADAALHTMPWFSGQKNKLRLFMAGGAIGSTGANYTWNSPFQLIVFLSTMVDNSLTTLNGHWGNFKGLPSILGSLETHTQNVQLIRTEFDTLMKKLAGGPVENLMRMQQLAPESAKAQEAIRIRDAVGRDIIRKIERPELEFESEHLRGDPEAAKIAMNIVSLYSSTAKDIVDLAKEEDYRGVEFDELVPIRLATGKLASAEDRTLSAFSEAITKQILTQIDNAPNYKVDPFVLYTAGLLPSIDNTQRGLQTMEELEKMMENEGVLIWKEIIISARGAELQGLENLSIGEAMKQARSEYDSGELRDKYGKHLRLRPSEKTYRPESEEFYETKIRPGVVALIRRLRSMKSDFGTASEIGLKGFAEKKYRRAITADNQSTRDILRELDSPLMHDAGLVKKGGVNPTPLNKATDVHIRNIVAGAGNNIFFRNAWAIPPVSTMMELEGVADLLIYDPASIADGMMRSLGQNANMKNFFRNNLKVRISGTGETTVGDKTPVHALLNLFNDVFADGNLLNSDQSLIQGQDIGNLQTSLKTLKEKIDVSLGRNSSLGTEADGALNWLVKYAPDMVRVVYGSNLTMATMLVENSMNLMDNLFGRGSIEDFVTAATAPFKSVLGKSDSDMRIAAKDMSEVLRVFSQAFIPDYLRPDAESRKNFIARLPQWLGERNMHMAGSIHAMIASSRAVIFRRWVMRHLADGSLANLPQHVKGVKPKDWKGLQDAMRKAKVRSTDYNIVAYLQNEGFFDDESMSIADIQSLISTRDDHIYSNSDMLLEASKIDMSTNEGQKLYRKRQKMIAALKRAEKRFIEDVLISPNPFDVNTTNDSWNKLMEIFRRYPVLFAAQQMVRRSRRFSPARTVFHLTSYALFDLLYMQMLLLAAGYSPEELRKNWTEKPTETAVASLIRLPHLGRYFGLLAEFSMIVAGFGYGRAPMGIIPLTALQSYGSQLKQVVHGSLSSEKDVDPHLPVMLLRILPMFGAFTRATWFNIMGADYQRPVSGKSAPRGTKRNHKGAFAETTNMADYHYLTRELLVSAGMYDPDDQNLFFRLPPEVQQAMREYAQTDSQLAARGPESPSQGMAAPQVPQQPSGAESPQRTYTDAIEQLEGMRPERAPLESIE